MAMEHTENGVKQEESFVKNELQSSVHHSIKEADLESSHASRTSKKEDPESSYATLDDIMVIDLTSSDLEESSSPARGTSSMEKFH